MTADSPGEGEVQSVMNEVFTEPAFPVRWEIWGQLQNQLAPYISILFQRKQRLRHPIVKGQSAVFPQLLLISNRN